MSYVGHVENGVVVLENGMTLPEGLKVRIEPVERESAAATTTQQDARQTHRPERFAATSIPTHGSYPRLVRPWPVRSS